jgi:hydrogenase expression/formation protein HypC
MKVVRINGCEGEVESGGLRRRADLSFLKGLKTGDYVLVHAGFAIEKVRPDEARRTLEALNEIR